MDLIAKFLPSVIALVGIPLAAWRTWLREKRLHQQQQRREDALRGDFTTVVGRGS